jgi:hypothetical protein
MPIMTAGPKPVQAANTVGSFIPSVKNCSCLVRERAADALVAALLAAKVVRTQRLVGGILVLA